jgi:D-glycero-D-manno-heptose 1,7-bisphosphate phosphatase
MKQLKNWSVFLDRDGVINEEVNYLRHPEQLKLIPGAAQAIRKLNLHQIPVIVVTNQAGVARGYFTEADVQLVHNALSEMLAVEGATINCYYYCPYHPTAGIGKYLLNSDWRKPQAGMLYQGAADFNLDLSRCYIVGDKASDILAGYNAGCKTVLVETGYGKKHSATWSETIKPNFLALNILDSIEWILTQEQ